jgi:hypothetical protein
MKNDIYPAMIHHGLRKLCAIYDMAMNFTFAFIIKVQGVYMTWSHRRLNYNSSLCAPICKTFFGATSQVNITTFQHSNEIKKRNRLSQERKRKTQNYTECFTPILT